MDFSAETGYTPEQAADIVKGSQGDYTALTGIEKDWLRRMFPFYSFAKISAKHYGNELLDRPGGLTGQTMRAAAEARDDNALVPEHIAETVAIPLGEDDEGNQSYVTGFGLGFEDPVSLFTPLAMGDFQGAGREIISRSNPLFKALVEGSLGVSSFQRGPQGARYLRTWIQISDGR